MNILAWWNPATGLGFALGLLCGMALVALVAWCSRGQLRWRKRQGASRQAVLAQIDQHALDVIVNNASMLSSFTRVVAFSRAQESSLQALDQSVHGLSESVETVVQSADISRQQVQSMYELALDGDRLLRETTEQITALGSSAHGLDSRFGEVRQHTAAIDGILSMIKNVAMQTHLLSLNAAVEAARAGEQGRGFAVVATEVRSLAQRSAQAAREIKVLIDSSVQKASAGGQLADEAGRTMSEIVGSVQQVSAMMGEIHAAARDQSAGIAQINQSVGQLDQMTQQNAALVEESAAAAGTVTEQAQRLAKVVAVFALSRGA